MLACDFHSLKNEIKNAYPTLGATAVQDHLNSTLK